MSSGLTSREKSVQILIGVGAMIEVLADSGSIEYANELVTLTEAADGAADAAYLSDDADAAAYMAGWLCAAIGSAVLAANR